jgi:hypothetical protein
LFLVALFFACFLVVSILINRNGINSYADEISTSVTKGQIDAAREWFDRNDIDVSALNKMSATDRSKMLTFLTYKFCRNSSETRSDLDTLYQDCATQCGGYSYFFRGLAAALGLRTRYARLYNIPNQGNHVAVEVEIEDKNWAFFDPTFGVFFSDTGLSENVLSLQQITTTKTLDKLLKIVKQANNQYELSSNQPLHELFDAEFNHRYMSVRNYMKPEALSTDHPDEMVILEIPMSLDRRSAVFGDFSSYKYEQLSMSWLNQTNFSLNDDDPLNDISYVTSQLTNAAEERLTLISLEDMVPNREYKAMIRFVNRTKIDKQLQISALGRGLQISNGGLVTLEPGTHDLPLNILSLRSFGQFYIRNLEADGIAFLFGIRVEESSR